MARDKRPAAVPEYGTQNNIKIKVESSAETSSPVFPSPIKSRPTLPLNNSGYMPTFPAYSPLSPTHGNIKSGNKTDSNTSMPTSPIYNPLSAKYGYTSNTYAPTSPTYSPLSSSYYPGKKLDSVKVASKAPMSGNNGSNTVMPRNNSNGPSDKENNSPKLAETATSPCPRLKLNLKPMIKNGHARSGSSSSNGSGISVKFSAEHWNSFETPANNVGETSKVTPLSKNDSAISKNAAKTSAGQKRTSDESTAAYDDLTDSDIDFTPIVRPKKAMKKTTTTKLIAKDTEPTFPTEKKVKVTKSNKQKTQAFKKAKIIHQKTDNDGDSDMSGAEDNGTILMEPQLKRSQRMLKADNPNYATLLASASKAGPEFYDSAAEDISGNVKGTNKPRLFRNVNWGDYAKSFTEGDFPTEPEWVEFVPGRYEINPDGSVSDQKFKLVLKLTDKKGNKRIFNNPPPKDWNNQEAITAMNKRTAQQIRRNTNVRFRRVVNPYAQEERHWILANLKDGKPGNWKSFVNNFNKKFEGTKLAGVDGPRPYRSHSSLTKEVERFGPKYYQKGLVPIPVADKDKRKKSKSADVTTTAATNAE